MRSLRGFVVVVAFAGLAGFGCGSDSSDATDLGSLKFDVTVSGHDTEVTSFDVPHADTAGSETVADTVQPGGDAVESGPDAIGPLSVRPQCLYGCVRTSRPRAGRTGFDSRRPENPGSPTVQWLRSSSAVAAPAAGCTPSGAQCFGNCPARGPQCRN